MRPHACPRSHCHPLGWPLGTAMSLGCMGLWGPTWLGAALGGWNMGLMGLSLSLPHPGARLRTICFLFPVGDSRFTLLLSLLAWLS